MARRTINYRSDVMPGQNGPARGRSTDVTAWARRLRGHSNINGEFDPGSGRTLAACLTHASRANLRVSGERVSNTWATCPELWDNPGKPGLIPDMTPTDIGRCGKIYRLGMGPRPISLLVG